MSCQRNGGRSQAGKLAIRKIQPASGDERETPFPSSEGRQRELMLASEERTRSWDTRRCRFVGSETMYQEREDFAVTDEHARESSQQPTRETATGGASGAVLEYGWARPHQAT